MEQVDTKPLRRVGTVHTIFNPFVLCQSCTPRQRADLTENLSFVLKLCADSLDVGHQLRDRIAISIHRFFLHYPDTALCPSNGANLHCRPEPVKRSTPWLAPALHEFLQSRDQNSARNHDQQQQREVTKARVAEARK